MINAGSYRWSSRCCFITVAVVLIPGLLLAGRICRPDYRTEALYRRVPAGGYHCRARRRDCAASQSRPVGVDQKYIRQRDLMGLIDQLVVLLVTECANDSQITALLNYILLTGDEARFNEFISEITRRLPQQRERIMTIAERIHNDGYIKGNSAFFDCFAEWGRS